MSFNNNDTLDDFGDFLSDGIYFQESEPANLSSMNSKLDREVFPELSDPADYNEYLPLRSSTTFNVKQGMQFINQETFLNKRFHPYNRPSTSHKEASTSQRQIFQPVQAIPSTHNRCSFSNCHQQENKTYSSTSKNEEKSNFSVVKNRASTCGTSFIIKNPKNDETKIVRQRMNLPGSKNRHLIGSVDQVLRWHKSVKNSDLSIIYETIGILEGKRSQQGKHLLFIRGESGHILQAVFYEVDRPITQCIQKSPIVVIGRMIGFRKMQAFDIISLDQEDHQAIKRLSFLSQRALNEALE